MKKNFDKDFKLLPRPCPLCALGYSKNNIRMLFKQCFLPFNQEYFVSECSRCGLIHQNPALGEKFYASLYGFFSGLYVYGSAAHKNYSAEIKRYKTIASVVDNLNQMPNKPRLLDFGCQDGSFLHWLKEKTKFGSKAQFFGYDILLKNIPENGRFYNNLDELINSGKKFDVIIINYVLEHVLEPRQLLASLAKSLLAEGGRLIIEVPNISFLMPADLSPTHIQHTNYFTPATLTNLINIAGLSLENITSLDNFILDRDPYAPGILAVGRKTSGYLQNGEAIKRTAFLKRKKFQDKIKKLTGGSTIAIAGCGDSLHTILSLFDKKKIAALYDNNRKLEGAIIAEHSVLPLAAAKNCPADFIIVSPTYKPSSDKMKEQLSKLVDPSKIITLFD